MRLKHLLIGLAALAWVGVWPTTAHGWTSGSTYCTSGFNACASVWLTAGTIYGSRSVQHYLDLTVEVGRHSEGVINNLGLFSLPEPDLIQFLRAWDSNNQIVSSNWTLSYSSQLGGFGDVAQVLANSNPGGIQPGETFRFRFFLRSAWNIDDTNVAWAFLSDDGTVWASTLATTDGSGSGGTDDGSLNPSPPEASVPEPGTMVLLGTGLIGILGMAGLRRRRNGLHVHDD